MMKVYRLSKTEYANDRHGTGSKLYGGRWNAVGTPCIYTAESRALAVLEYAVNVNIDFVPLHLSMCVFEIDMRQIKSFTIDDLPENWRTAPASLSTKNFGSKFLKNGAPILKIPSVVIPDEFNYVINPKVDKPCFELEKITDFTFDLRIKQ